MQIGFEALHCKMLAESWIEMRKFEILEKFKKKLKSLKDYSKELRKKARKFERKRRNLMKFEESPRMTFNN